ncbi:MAG: amidohydrolase family protein [Gemmatimonadaceae bacterium]
MPRLERTRTTLREGVAGVGTSQDEHFAPMDTDRNTFGRSSRVALPVLAMAAGCSTNAEAERDRFAKVLSPRRGAAALESLTPMTLFQHERALYHARNPAACTATIEAYRRNGVGEAPNIVAYHNVVHAKEILSDTAIMRFVPEPIRSNWNVVLDSDIYPPLKSVLQPMVPLYAENARLLYEAGVVLLAATDVGIPAVVPGVSLHEELALLVEAGLTPLASLQTATLNPARVLGMSDSLGTIEVGKLADLILLDANPLADIRNTRRIRAVVVDGKIYTSAELERFAAEVTRSLQRPKDRE